MTTPGSRTTRGRSCAAVPPAAAALAVALAATDFVLVELNPAIVHARGAVAVDALADEEVLR